MDTCMHKTMVSVVSLGKIEIIRSQEFMPSEVRLKFLKKMIILRPKTAILGPKFCRILVMGPQFWWSGGPWPPGPPGSTPVENLVFISTGYSCAITSHPSRCGCQHWHFCHWCCRHCGQKMTSKLSA